MNRFEAFLLKTSEQTRSWCSATDDGTDGPWQMFRIRVVHYADLQRGPVSAYIVQGVSEEDNNLHSRCTTIVSDLGVEEMFPGESEVDRSQRYLCRMRT